MSKFAERGGAGLGLARAAYVGAILAYIGGVAVPRWINYRRAEEQKKRRRGTAGSTLEEAVGHGSPEKKRPAGKRRGPAVNREFFAHLSKLLKVNSRSIISRKIVRKVFVDFQREHL
jgi:hypothetical protein